MGARACADGQVSSWRENWLAAGVMSSRRNVLFLRADPAGLDLIEQGMPIAIGLIGISHREFGDGFVEFGPLPI